MHKAIKNIFKLMPQRAASKDVPTLHFTTWCPALHYTSSFHIMTLMNNVVSPQSD